MKNKFGIILICALFLMPVYGRGQQTVRKLTFDYAVKDGDTLRLDKYDIPCTGSKPCMIFMFGGGFFSGARDQELYMGYFDHIVEKGFTVISIDYRLGFKSFAEAVASGSESAGGKKTKAKDFLALFERTIMIAVEDLFDATLLVLDNAASWDVDTSKILLSGSSAGAISVLQGEYERCNRSAVAQVLPEDFRYAGVIAFAGAVYSNNGHLKWRQTPAPVQLFHGDADSNVPFDKIKFCKLGFFGSQYIAARYEKYGYPYYLYVEENADHSLAASPMTDNLEEIDSFLRKYIMQEAPYSTVVKIRSAERPEVKKNFGLKDYIKKNFGI